MGQDFKKLIAWSKSMDIVADICEATRTFPKEEIYGLTAQIRRAAVSIPSNIAERSGALLEEGLSALPTASEGFSRGAADPSLDR